MERNDNLLYILRTLTGEQAEYAALNIPATLPERQQMMRALQNVRHPSPVDMAFLQAQDTELQQHSFLLHIHR